QGQVGHQLAQPPKVRVAALSRFTTGTQAKLKAQMRQMLERSNREIAREASPAPVIDDIFAD
ncbi:MAG TPA: hypothetical protein VFU31_10655, partial [Candidatus Binatia bacterium]|nr:hypothetical protein [Candidatus Binatia bacterium]